MSTMKSGIWGLALPLSFVFLGAVYYVKMPAVRQAVDARTPVVHNLLGRFVQESGTKVIVTPGVLDPAFAQPKPTREPVAALATPAPTITKAPEHVAPPVAPVVSASPKAGPPDLQTIANDRTKWPKKVVLNKPATFPAVLNGKVVGSLTVPAGAEAKLLSIKEDKVALEFNGGGAWLPASQTDLLARVQGGGQ